MRITGRTCRWSETMQAVQGWKRLSSGSADSEWPVAGRRSWDRFGNPLVLTAQILWLVKCYNCEKANNNTTGSDHFHTLVLT